MWRVLSFAVLLAIAATSAQAQAPAAPQPAPVPVPDPAYQQRLERFAEVLGALHHLRGLCQPEEREIWRQEMAAFLTAEQPAQDRRERIVGAFNRAMAALAEAHRICTPVARLAGDRYRIEAAQLAREIVGRFAE
jgi:uncharacterized protein (TIGR02301 family)